MASDMTTNTDLARAHGAMPELPDPTYIYHTSDEEGGDDLFEFSHSGAVDIDEHYDGGVCADCVRLYTADQMREYARAAIQQAAVAVPEGHRIVPIEPTPEMLTAGRDVLGEHVEDTDSDYRRIYRGFLSAAPEVNRDQVHSAGAGAHCHNDACSAGQLPCPTPTACCVQPVDGPWKSQALAKLRSRAK